MRHKLRPRVEHRSVTALLDALAGTGKSLLFTSGSGVFLQRTAGAWSPDSFAEDEPFELEPLAATRFAVETMVRASSAQSIRGMVLRPSLVWGSGDHGHIALTYRSIAITGAACHVGEGLAAYSNVHVQDVAELFALALDKGEAGNLYHAASGEIANRRIAEHVAADMGCETRSVTMAEATEIWGQFGALIMGASNRARAPRSQSELGWTARHFDDRRATLARFGQSEPADGLNDSSPASFFGQRATGP